MIWLLRLFSAYRHLEAEKTHVEQICSTLQASNAALEQQNAWLKEHLEKADAQRDYAMKTMVNLSWQDKHGVPAVYPEAYTLPEVPVSEPGPMETNRVSAFDVRHEQVREYRNKLVEIVNKLNSPQAS